MIPPASQRLLAPGTQRGRARRPRRTAKAFLALVLAALPSLARATGHPPLPPGLEPRVLELLSAATASLPDGWRLGSGLIGADKIDVELVNSSAQKVRIELRDPLAQARSLRVGRSPSFSVWLASGDVPAVAHAFLAGLSAVDDGGFWAGAAAPPAGRATVRQQMRERPSADLARWPAWLSHADGARRIVAWASLLIALLLALPRMARQDVCVLAAILAVAAMIRLGWVAPGPIHANDHGVAELRGLAGAPLDEDVPVLTDQYGLAYGRIVRAVSRAFGGGAEGAFRVGAIGSSFAAATCGLAALALVRSKGAALIAGLAMALHRDMSVLGPTESPFSLAAALLALALAAVAMTFADGTRGRGTWVVVASCSTSCGLELGVTTLLIPVVVVMFALSVARWPLVVRHRGWLTAGTTLIALTITGHVLALQEVLRDALASRSAERLAVPARLASLTWAQGSEVLVAVALLGLLIGLRRLGARVVGALIVTATVLLSGGLTVSACETDRIRYLSLAWVPLAIAAGLAGGVRDRWRASGVVAAAITVIAVSSLPRLAPLRDPAARIDTWTWWLVRRFEVDPTDRLVVRLPPRRMGRVLADFPDNAIAPRVQSLVLARDDIPLPSGHRCLVWIPPACWRHEKERANTGDAAGLDSSVSIFRRECEPLWALAAEPPPKVPAWRGVIADDFHQVPADGRARAGLVPCVTDQAGDQGGP